jgi:F0F1-type ATP synthase assembly protein I
LVLLLTWVSSIFLYSKSLGSGSLFYPNQFFFFFFFFFPRLESRRE